MLNFSICLLGLFAGIFSFTSCRIQRYRREKDWVSLLSLLHLVHRQNSYIELFDLVIHTFIYCLCPWIWPIRCIWFLRSLPCLYLLLLSSKFSIHLLSLHQMCDNWQGVNCFEIIMRLVGRASALPRLMYKYLGSELSGSFINT